MKLLKLSLILGALATCANAATITVSAGFGTQGFNVTTNGTTSLPSFLVAVGGYSGGVFTQFGSVLDSAKVSGVITATSPTTLNSQIINLFVGNGTTVENSTSWVILSPTANTAFPANVTQATGVTYAATLGTNQNLVASSNATWSATTALGGGAGAGLITMIPEPSAALLGALGALGLLRRRRI
jgi:hypothetical protein